MKTFVIYQSYDPQIPIGRMELEDDVSDEAIADCVLGPCVLVAANGSILGVKAFGMFPRVNTDIRPRE